MKPKIYTIKRKLLLATRAFLLVARSPAPGIAASNKKLLGAPGLTTRSKDATRGSWPYYQEQEAICNKGI